MFGKTFTRISSKKLSFQKMAKSFSKRVPKGPKTTTFCNKIQIAHYKYCLLPKRSPAYLDKKEKQNDFQRSHKLGIGNYVKAHFLCRSMSVEIWIFLLRESFANLETDGVPSWMILVRFLRIFVPNVLQTGL
jgi:hypothetical protein